MTRQRRLILELMQQSPRHLTADEIFAQARTRMPNIARGTVYRNLKLMEQAGGDRPAGNAGWRRPL